MKRFPGRGQQTRSLVRPEVEFLEDRCLPSSTPFTADPIVPVIDPAMKAHLRAVYQLGLRLGNRPNVFAKVGDSITATPSFLTDLGGTGYDPNDPAVAGPYTGLASVINYFRGAPVDGTGANSFNRVSLAAYPGWQTADVLSPARGTPLTAELTRLKPSFALIMLGTNDSLAMLDPVGVELRLANIANVALSLGVIPVLSTIPDDLYNGGAYEGYALNYNQAIADVAAGLEIPLWNYWQAMQPLANKGVDSHGVHPTVDPNGGGDFTNAGLQYGYNVRNLTAVEVLQKLATVVIADGLPDAAGQPTTAQDGRYVNGVYQAVLGRAPEPAMQTAWVQLLQGGLPRQALAQAVWQSGEHRAAEINQYFVTYLRRAPSPAETAAWVQLFAAGVSEETVQQAVLGSPEYRAARSGTADLLAAFYNDVLGRSPDPTGSALWQANLQAGANPANVAQAFLTSPERENALIAADYAAFLGRSAHPAEEAAWQAVLPADNFTGTAAVVILGSDEFWRLAH